MKVWIHGHADHVLKTPVYEYPQIKKILDAKMFDQKVFGAKNVWIQKILDMMKGAKGEKRLECNGLINLLGKEMKKELLKPLDWNLD